MMMNLFSSFDPSVSSSFLFLNWSSILIVFFLLPSKFWVIPSKFIMTINILLKHMTIESSTLMNKKEKMNSIIYSSIFLYIIINNFMGLFPYIFTGTSHLSLNLSMALMLWTSIMIFSILKKTNKMLSHMVPTGTPALLMNFMVIIESISLLIRPIALSVRLTANMIAGHLLLTLASSTISNVSMSLALLLISTQTILIILEMAVSIIQAYVFSILVVLYASEI